MGPTVEFKKILGHERPFNPHNKPPANKILKSTDVSIYFNNLCHTKYSLISKLSHHLVVLCHINDSMETHFYDHLYGLKNMSRAGLFIALKRLSKV